MFALTLALFPTSTRFQEPAEPGFDHEHKQWTSVLAAHVHADRVDYAALARDRGVFDQYLAKLASQDRTEFAKWSKSERFAFWINAYNAFTVQAVLLNYPLQDIDSIRDVGGKQSGKIWKQRNLHLGQLIEDRAEAEISLEELLNLVLRPQFKDARVHAALCTSCLGSPALRAEAFRAADLDKQLDAAARAWLADPLRTRFSSQHKRVECSLALQTYREDFEHETGSVESWIKRYAPVSERVWLESAGELELRTLAFDWKLNDVEHDAK
jgi:hypothetical protein